ncbi:MAG: accessory gene regulator B family protein [Syntrophomonadaceae bacterium]|nr:accessory gene regulator B family protein [Syntrophomonadaceae bacterium]
MNLIAKRLAHLLAENAPDTFYEDEIRYGLEIYLGALFQLLLIILVAMLLGIAGEVAVVAMAAALYRRYSGGAHCQAFYRCTLTSLVAFNLFGLASNYLPLSYWSYYIILTGVCSAMIIRCYVPVDNPGLRITDEAIRAKRRQQSYGVILLVIMASILLQYIQGAEIFSVALLIGLMWQNFTLIPAGHKCTCFLDHIFGKMEKMTRERGYHNDKEI